MNKLDLRTLMRVLMPLVSSLFMCGANASDTPHEPMAVLNALADRIYVLGETSGNASDMVAAEVKAAAEILQYIASGATSGLLGKENGQQSPLAAAAYMGYPNVTSALLTSDLVLAHINDADGMGLTPWIATNLSMKQALWTCNPATFEDPFKFVPMFVTQPYYLSGTASPYRRTREVLESAGAFIDLGKAKDVWLTNCKNQLEGTKAKVEASTDLLKTVQELGASDLTAQLIKLQKQAAETGRIPPLPAGVNIAAVAPTDSISVSAARNTPAPNTPGANAVLVQLGNTVQQVQAAYSTTAQPVSANIREKPETTFIRVLETGTWFFFDHFGKIETIRVEAPFTGHVAGVTLGTSESGVINTLGQPTRKFTTGTTTAMVYAVDGSYHASLRFDIQGRLTTIFLVK